MPSGIREMGNSDEKQVERQFKMVGLSTPSAAGTSKINQSFSGEGITHKIITKVKKQA